MSQGLFNEEEKEEDELHSDDEQEGLSTAPVRAVDRKTKQQRRKEKELQQEVSSVQREKAKKRNNLTNEIFSRSHFLRCLRKTMQISKCNKQRNIVIKINDKYNLILENNQNMFNRS